MTSLMATTFMDHLAPTLRLALPTLQHASAGLVTGLVAAILINVVRKRSKLLDLLYRPIVIAAFCIPTYAISMFARAAGVPSEAAWILVGLTLIIPFETALAKGRVEADTLDVVEAGTVWRRFWLIRLPAMLPSVLKGMAIAVPWALLGTMLIETVEGGQRLGVRLATAALSSFDARVWLISVVVAISFTGYMVFVLLSEFIRQRLGLRKLPSRRAIMPPESVEFGPFAFFWGCLLVTGIWYGLSLNHPVTVGTPLDAAPLGQLMPLLPIHVVQTLKSILISLLLGTVVGVAAVFLAMAWPWTRALIVALLIPLQIVPLHAITVWLIMLSRATTPPLTFEMPADVVLDMASITIGFLCSAYLIFEHLSDWLQLLPGRGSGLLSCIPPLNGRLLWIVNLPWLARGVGALLPLLLPRVLLAVLVTEYLVTKRGIGGALAATRANMDFKENFMLLIILIVLAFLIQMLTTLYVRLNNANLR